MKSEYKHYTDITREILDTVKVGDLVKINNWKRPLRVKAVSKNYFVMAMPCFGEVLYSVCSKMPWNGIRHNKMVGGMFHCGTDNWIFGSPLVFEHENIYEFKDEECNRIYLESFEKGETELSHRSAVAIYDLYIKAI